MFSNITLSNPSAQAEEIGQKQLRAILDAGRLPVLHDTDQLLGVVLEVQVKTVSDQQSGATRSEVKRYRSLPTASQPMPGYSQRPQFGQQSQPAPSAFQTRQQPQATQQPQQSYAQASRGYSGAQQSFGQAPSVGTGNLDPFAR